MNAKDTVVGIAIALRLDNVKSFATDSVQASITVSAITVDMSIPIASVKSLLEVAAIHPVNNATSEGSFFSRAEGCGLIDSANARSLSRHGN